MRRRPDGSHALVSRIGDQVVDLRVLAEIGIFDDAGVEREDFKRPALNRLIGRGKAINAKVRNRLTAILDREPSYFNIRHRAEIFLLPAERVELVLPLAVGDFTDFYSSREHATSVSELFRPGQAALPPNWAHMPIAYHSRASSIVGDGTPIRRPEGQWLDERGDLRFGASRKLDFEVELAFVIGEGNLLGHPVPVAEAERHIFGVALLNDWSARDVQLWEYQPLGPFLSKSFASTLAHWITPLEALEGARVAGPVQLPAPLPYLSAPVSRPNLDLTLEAWLTPKRGEPHRLTRTNARHLYWSMAQQLAHHTVNGCNLRPGDVCGSGTISGPTPESAGTLLELSRNGTRAIDLGDDVRRTWLEDGDTLELRAAAESGGVRFELGPCRGQIKTNR